MVRADLLITFLAGEIPSEAFKAEVGFTVLSPTTSPAELEQAKKEAEHALLQIAREFLANYRIPLLRTDDNGTNKFIRFMKHDNTRYTTVDHLVKKLFDIMDGTNTLTQVTAVSEEVALEEYIEANPRKAGKGFVAKPAAH